MTTINEFFASRFTKHIPYNSSVQALVIRYQALCIAYINLSFLFGILVWSLIDSLLFSLPGNDLLLPILPILAISLIALRCGKVNIAAASLLLSLHASNFICTHAGRLVLGTSQLVFLMPGIGSFISSSKCIHIFNVILCILQNIGHVYSMSSVFSITFTEEQAFQIFVLKTLSFPILVQSFLIAFIQKSIESKLWQMAQSNYERAENITKELVQAVESKDAFVSSFSHEIRNPLNSMSGSIDYLLRVVTEPAYIQILENAKLSGEVLLNLMNNILDAAKLKSDKMELSYMETNPLDIIKKVFTINSSALNHKKISAQAFIDKNLPKKLTLDSSRVLQVVMNLFSNAMKFTFDSGRIQLHMIWCSPETTQEELLRPTEMKSLVDVVNYETELDKMIERPNNQRKYLNTPELSQYGTTVINDSRTSLDSLCNSPVHDFANYEEFDTRESQSRLDNMQHLNDQKKVKGLHQVYTFHSRLNENYEIVTVGNVNAKSLNSLDEIANASVEKPNAKGYLKVQLTDSGCGIAEENISKLFNMFSQANASISRNYGGSGLGLWISKQLCQKMGGDIVAHSKPNQGTTFVFYIEVDNSIPAQDSPKTNFRRCHDKVRALVVDDYAYNRDLHKLILEREGVEVYCACDGNEAVEKYINHEPNFFDFIMMDIQMPELDGLAAAQQIRIFEDTKKIKRTKIYFVSGNYYASEAGRLVENIPNTQFLRKPVNLDIIRNVVDNYKTIVQGNSRSFALKQRSETKGDVRYKERENSHRRDASFDNISSRSAPIDYSTLQRASHTGIMKNPDFR